MKRLKSLPCYRTADVQCCVMHSMSLSPPYNVKCPSLKGNAISIHVPAHDQKQHSKPTMSCSHILGGLLPSSTVLWPEKSALSSFNSSNGKCYF